MWQAIAKLGINQTQVAESDVVLAGIDGLQQITETMGLLCHAVPEDLVPSVPQQPGVAAIGFFLGECGAVHRIEGGGSRLREGGDGFARSFGINLCSQESKSDQTRPRR